MSKLALVTGGSGGIGFASASALVERGYDVVLTSRREEPLRVAAGKIGARWVAADASDDASFGAVVSDLGDIHLLVHAAGILGGTFVRKERIETFDEVIRINLRSAFVTVAAVLPKMPVGGRIIFISSTAGRRGMRGRAAYSASKAGMNAFAEALRSEVARDGINVNVLIPAPVDTDMLEQVTFPMHTLQSKDVAAAVAFLDSLHPSVVLAEMVLQANDTGPLAPEPILPERYRERRSVG